MSEKTFVLDEVIFYVQQNYYDKLSFGHYENEVATLCEHEDDKGYFNSACSISHGGKVEYHSYVSNKDKERYVIYIGTERYCEERGN